MANGKKFSIQLSPDDLEWSEFRAFTQRTSLTQYIIGCIRQDREQADEKVLEEFEAARAMRETPSDAQDQADEAVE